jgi:nucleotide-binding universal stress UspA family protein
MLQSLIVPLGGSDLSARALPAAVSIADASGADIRLVGVARNDGEFWWTYDRVLDASRALSGERSSDIEVLVDGDPTNALLKVADDTGNVLCLASHDRAKPLAEIMHSVASLIIERATNPFLVVGPRYQPRVPTNDVVVALDGVSATEPLLSTAVAWAVGLGATLRIVTVYEPVLADLRTPTHFTRHHGPPIDPGAYLGAIMDRIDDDRLSVVDAESIPDPVSVTAGLTKHLDARPARLLVIGGRRAGPHVLPGTLRALLRAVTLPILVASGKQAHAVT